jgi:hypothetical protein
VMVSAPSFAVLSASALKEVAMSAFGGKADIGV